MPLKFDLSQVFFWFIWEIFSKIFKTYAVAEVKVKDALGESEHGEGQLHIFNHRMALHINDIMPIDLVNVRGVVEIGWRCREIVLEGKHLLEQRPTIRLVLERHRIRRLRWLI